MKNIYKAPECEMLLLESEEVMIKNSGEIDANGIDLVVGVSDFEF